MKPRTSFQRLVYRQLFGLSRKPEGAPDRLSPRRLTGTPQQRRAKVASDYYKRTHLQQLIYYQLNTLFKRG